MEHMIESADKAVGTELNEAKIKTVLQENKMEGLDPKLLAALKSNGVSDGKNDHQWDNPLFWLIILGFLRGKGGIFGGGEGDAGGGAAIGAIQAKLDCLQQGQQDAALSALGTNMTNQHHSSEMSRQNDASRMAAQLAECCCNLGKGQERIINEIVKCCCTLQAGQKDIVNEMCKQTQLIVTNATANTQRIIDNMNRLADDEKTQKLNDCKTALSNAEQTKELLAAMNSGGHRGGG